MKEVISFRPSEPFGKAVENDAEKLGVKTSVIARMSFEYGYRQAIKELAAKKRQVKRALGSFDSADSTDCQPFSLAA